MDSGLFSLLMIAAYHGIAVDEAKLRHEFSTDTFSTQTLMLAAKSLGFGVKLLKQDINRLTTAPLPAIASDKNGQFFILAKVDESDSSSHKVLIQYPQQPPQVISMEDFVSLWSTEVIYMTSKASYAGEIAKFDFSWFIPAIVKYRKLLSEVLLISFVLQIIALVTPMFFQVVMDKVLVNNALKTLDVIVIGLLAATLFEISLTGIRTYVFSHTSSKIDVELGAKLFRHLLSLPISYFQARRVGDSVARIRELENIRSFLR